MSCASAVWCHILLSSLDAIIQPACVRCKCSPGLCTVQVFTRHVYGASVHPACVQYKCSPGMCTEQVFPWHVYSVSVHLACVQYKCSPGMCTEQVFTRHVYSESVHPSCVQYKCSSGLCREQVFTRHVYSASVHLACVHCKQAVLSCVYAIYMWQVQAKCLKSYNLSNVQCPLSYTPFDVEYPMYCPMQCSMSNVLFNGICLMYNQM